MSFMPRTTRRKARPGRPNGPVKGPLQNFRLSRNAASALGALQKKWGWTKVSTVERAILFAAKHDDFTPSSPVMLEVNNHANLAHAHAKADLYDDRGAR